MMNYQRRNQSQGVESDVWSWPVKTPPLPTATSSPFMAFKGAQCVFLCCVRIYIDIVHNVHIYIYAYIYVQQGPCSIHLT